MNKKKIIKDVIIILLMAGAFLLLLLGALGVSGCIKWKVPVSGGKYIVHERWWSKASADKADFYYKDPNVTVLISVNDPNVSVNPGRLSVVEPRTGIKGEMVTE